MILAGARRRIPTMVDGVNATAAALLAYGLEPACADYMLCSHLSAEISHAKMLEVLRLTPIVDAGMRLGEGTGASLAIVILQMAINTYKELYKCCLLYTSEQVQQLTRKAVDSLPGIEGVNNHQGSKATSNEATMKAVLKVLKQQGLFFVDSSTYSKSIGDQVARSMGVPTAHNNIFLDNSSDEDDIIAKIWQAVEMADRNGRCV